MSSSDRQMYVLQLVRANPAITVDMLCIRTGRARGTIINDVYLLRKAGLLTTFLKKGKRNVVRG